MDDFVNHQFMDECVTEGDLESRRGSVFEDLTPIKVPIPIEEEKGVQFLIDSSKQIRFNDVKSPMFTTGTTNGKVNES